MSAEQFVEMGILSAVAWPGIRAACSSAYWRVFPFDTIRIAATTAIYLLVISLVSWYEPRWLRVPAVLGALYVGYLVWRSGPRFGVASGLAPGSLWPLPTSPFSDPEFYKKQRARHGDLFKLCQFGRPMICIVGLERINRLLREHDQKLVAPPLPFSRFIQGGYLRYLPEETHSHYRRFFRALFHSSVVDRALPRITSGFRDSLRFHSGAGIATAVEPLVHRMMFAAWTDLFYGIDSHHADFVRLQELSSRIDTRKARWAAKHRIDSALGEIEAILRRRAAEFAKAESSASCFLALLTRDNPDMLGDRTVLGNLIYITQVTWGDVSGLLIWIFKMLSDHGEWRDRLARDPSPELATRIVQETLRLEQSESRYRRAVDDLELDGFRIPKGWLVRMCIRESHQEEAVFAQPAKFDPDRFAERAFDRGEYAPFGYGRLACIGEDLTKAVAATFAVELATGFDWTVAEDGPAAISDFAHNAPSPRFSVRMVERHPDP